MLYVPMKIYPDERSVRMCAAMATMSLGAALAALLRAEAADMRVAVMMVCMVGFCVSVVNGVAAMRRQPMIKVLDDRFSVYTPFGYAVIRFGDVLAFRQKGIPGLRNLCVTVNASTSPRFPSGIGRLLNALIWMRFSNSISVQGYMLGAEIDVVVQMLEKRRLAAVRLEAIGDYDPTALRSAI